MYGRMARTKLYDPFDIGIEGLLTSSFDDPDFDFDLFMENLRQDCPELARDLDFPPDDHSASAAAQTEYDIQPQQPPQPQLVPATSNEPQPGMQWST